MIGSGNAKLKKFIIHSSGKVKETDPVPEFRGKMEKKKKKKKPKKTLKVISCRWYL